MNELQLQQNIFILFILTMHADWKDKTFKYHLFLVFLFSSFGALTQMHEVSLSISKTTNFEN